MAIWFVSHHNPNYALKRTVRMLLPSRYHRLRSARPLSLGVSCFQHMSISPANAMLAASVLLIAVSILWQSRLKSRAPELRALLIESNPIRTTDKSMLLLMAAVVFTSHAYAFVAFTVLLLVVGIASVVQHRALLRLGADPSFVNHWSGTSALLFLGGAAFTVALYLGA
jgi:hypothetical protein